MPRRSKPGGQSSPFCQVSQPAGAIALRTIPTRAEARRFVVRSLRERTFSPRGARRLVEIALLPLPELTACRFALTIGSFPPEPGRSARRDEVRTDPRPLPGCRCPYGQVAQLVEQWTE